MNPIISQVRRVLEAAPNHSALVVVDQNLTTLGQITGATYSYQPPEIIVQLHRTPMPGLAPEPAPALSQLEHLKAAYEFTSQPLVSEFIAAAIDLIEGRTPVTVRHEPGLPPSVKTKGKTKATAATTSE